MTNGAARLPHVFLTGTATVERYTAPGAGGGRLRLPVRDRRAHGARLLQQLQEAGQQGQHLAEERRALGIQVADGICLQFESDPDFDLKFDSLEAVQSGIELLAVRETEGRIVATVLVPEGKLARFLTMMQQYLERDTPGGAPRYRSLVEGIAAIQAAALEAFWTDHDQLPGAGDVIWWEVWLRGGNDSEAVLASFRAHAPLVGLQLSPAAARSIRFPDRTVVLAQGSREQMARSAELLNCIAELRRAKDTAQLFTEMAPWDQAEWVQNALARIQPPGLDAPAVCLLDTGVNREHPLVAPGLASEDLNTCDPTWGSEDHNRHGTEMAGLALYGDLLGLFGSEDSVALTHRLESVKILPRTGENPPEIYGALTIEAVGRVEVTAPTRQRAICMAVTTTDSRDRGEPSSWSAAVDKLAAGADDDMRRLVILSAGNSDRAQCHLYPDSNRTDGIHDPGQAWNALTVGAYTDKDTLDPATHPDWQALAPRGGLSPSSCTSVSWTGPWPIKPDIVVEGGNLAIDPGTGQPDPVDSLWLLTTHWRPTDRLLTVTGETSAAAAQAARMAAILQAAYPNYWPETIRALLVHSASWTPAMLGQCQPVQSRREREALLKFCGFGVPDLDRALWSASNSLTLIAQDQLQPYDRTGISYTTRDMHLHAIPWPTEVLRDLGETRVRMRVTLSYFVEPNPGRRGWKYRHRYGSHGLRFKVKTAVETLAQFRARINKAAREEEMGQRSRSDEGDWFLGEDLRGRGSIHSDWWEGTASDLAERGHIGVYPVIGWWRERHQLGRWSRLARYALVVTIETPEVDVDLYTPVVNQIAVPIQIQTVP